MPLDATLDEPALNKEVPSLPPTYGAPGSVLLAAPEPGVPAEALRVVGHRVLECHGLARLRYLLKHGQPDLVCLHAHAVGSLSQALGTIRSRHAQVPVVLLTPDPEGRLGAVSRGYYAGVPDSPETTELVVAAAHAIAHHRLVRRVVHLESLAAGDSFAGIDGKSVSERRVMRQLRAFALGDVHVLFKEGAGANAARVARAVHDHSARGRGPFLALDGRALTKAAFGVESGLGDAHLEASQHGVLSEAHGGTVFLSHVDALSSALQSELLKLLAEESVCDIRLIAATTVDLDEQVHSGAFRTELLQHFGQHRIELPGKSSLPGVGSSRRLMALDGEAALSDSEARLQRLRQMLAEGPLKMRDIERCAIEAALSRAQDNLCLAVRELGIGRSTLYRKLRRYQRA